MDCKRCLATLSAASLLSTGLLRAQLDYAPQSPEVLLDTDSTVVQPTNGPPITVNGGVFVFRHVTIANGVHLRAVGSRPMIWIVDDLSIDGDFDVSGGPGERLGTPAPADVPLRGGRGGPAGGRGGNGSPQVALRSFAGMAGNGPGDAPGMGGMGGSIRFGTGAGSGGGGGAFATAGDPYYKVLAAGTGFAQQLGIGGFGGSGPSGSATRSLPGGGPGGVPFVDGNDENDFFGNAIDMFRGRVVVGELPLLVGGAGGGGGGDVAVRPGLLPLDFAFDLPGGAGGGGGGCLLVLARNRILVGPNGRIRANGGDGGSGDPAASGDESGGGGGSGGLVILASGGTIELHVKGETYANDDYHFVVSADGGACATAGLNLLGKYPATLSGPVAAGSLYDDRPRGAFGGMGIVELATFAGTNADGTNTVLDDNILLFQNGQPLFGALKQRFLAWRGFKDITGQRVDDFGNPVVIGANEGDIRPAPVLIRL